MHYNILSGSPGWYINNAPYEQKNSVNVLILLRLAPDTLISGARRCLVSQQFWWYTVVEV